MRPYLAVIIDSFHAALSSRVLWIAFVAIWILLGFLSPIGYRENFTTTFREGDFHNGTRMKAMLAQGLVDPASAQTPIGRLAAAMPEELRRQLRRVGEGDEVRIRLTVLSDALNGLLDDDSWFDPTAWESSMRLKELRELDALDEVALDESTRRRRARLRIEAAMPGVFASRASRSIFLTYAGMDFPAKLSVEKNQFETLINQWVLPTIINWLLGFVLIFLGILVTASIVPDMLQPGSLHLLLSKPVSRTLLLISKFIGGCAFVLLCVMQLVVGLYLIAGYRLDVWNSRLLWCIPVSVFLFSVFYSVSTLSGLRWRSPILAIGVTTFFGAICLIVGVIGGLFDGFVTRPDQIQTLAVAGDQWFGSTRGGGLVRYDRGQNRWIEIFESDAMNPDRIVPPIVLDENHVVVARIRNGRFNPFGSGALDLLVLSDTDQWTPEPSLRLPTATTSLYRVGGDSLLALNTGDLAITSRANVVNAIGRDGESSPSANEGSQNNGWLSKLTSMMGGATSGFHSVLPERIAITPPRSIAVDREGGWLVAMSRGRLFRLVRPETNSDRWTLAVDRTLEGEASLRGVIAISGDVILVSRAEAPIDLFDSASLESIGQVELPEPLIPVAVTGLADERRFALVTSDGRCRIVGPRQQPPDGFQVSNPIGPREAETVHHDPLSGSILISHHIDQVDVLDALNFAVRDRIRPSLQRWRLIDRMVMTPLRSVIPQTGELGETISAMVSGKSAISIAGGSEEDELVRYKIVRPVASCAAFIAVMLTISCVYFSTRDF